MMGWSCWQSEEQFRLLLALLRDRPPTDLEPGQVSALGDPVFGSALLDLAARHRVHGLTVSRLARLGSRAGLEPVVRAELASRLAQLRRRSAVFTLKRERTLEILGRASIRPVVLKGAGTSLTIYAAAAERDVGDLDLLVRKDQVDPALKSLESAGYRRPSAPGVVEAYRRLHFHVPLDGPDGHRVEVHWGLTLPRSPFFLASEDVLERAITIEPPGTPPLRIPCYEHQLLHVVLQNIQESFSHLGRLVEIDRIAQRTVGFDWEQLFHAARCGRIEVPLAISLRLARRLLGTPIPERPLHSAQPSRVSSFHIAIMRPEEHLVRQWGKREIVAPRLLELWMVPGAGAKLRHLGRFLSEDSSGWICRERRRIGRWEKSKRLARLVVDQIKAYVGAGPMLLRPAGRKELSVWTRYRT